MHCALVMHMAMHTETDLVGSSEVCRILDCNPSTVGRWVKSGHLRYAHKLPGRNGAYLFHRADVDKFAADRAATEQSEASA
jgi:excisionase family DNA binding protein